MAEEGKKRPILIAAREKGPGPGRYALPSTVGFVKHDCTKDTKPAYSFGRRLFAVDNVYKKDCSPGPAYYIDPKITKTGVDGTPVYSMLSRQRDPNLFQTPAPDRYSPEKVHPQGEDHAPKYSFGSRCRNRKCDPNPSPNKYKLPPVIGKNQPYKREPPAYSMVSRPMVGCYLEDLSKTPGPGRYKTVSNDCTMTRVPHYSLRYRSFMPGDNVKKPGPGAHHPEKVIINKKIAPKYSLGIRHSEYVCPMIADFYM